VGDAGRPALRAGEGGDRALRRLRVHHRVLRGGPVLRWHLAALRVDADAAPHPAHGRRTADLRRDQDQHPARALIPGAPAHMRAMTPSATTRMPSTVSGTKVSAWRCAAIHASTSCKYAAVLGPRTSESTTGTHTNTVATTTYPVAAATLTSPDQVEAEMVAATSTVRPSRFGPPTPRASPAAPSFGTLRFRSRASTALDRPPARDGCGTGGRERTRAAATNSATPQTTSSAALNVSRSLPGPGTVATPRAKARAHATACPS